MGGGVRLKHKKNGFQNVPKCLRPWNDPEFSFREVKRRKGGWGGGVGRRRRRKFANFGAFQISAEIPYKILDNPGESWRVASY